MSRLRELLDDARAFAPEHHGGLSNHLPMALTALHALGADDARLSAFFDGHVPRLDAAPAAGQWEAGRAWADRLGEPGAFADYQALFTEWLLHERPEAVLPQVLPVLMRGVGAAAFHGLIRTAYAVQAQHLGELAEGLAYWACRFLPLGALPDEPAGRHATDDPEVALRSLRASPSRARLIFERMRDAAAEPQLHAAVARLRIGERTLPQLAQLAAWAYAGSGNFAVLHLLTSAHAMRLLLPYVDEPLLAVRAYWQAYAAAVVAAGIERRPEPHLQPWDAIVAHARASDDDHVIKLVHSCREESKVYGGVAWQFAASRVVR